MKNFINFISKLLVILLFLSFFQPTFARVLIHTPKSFEKIQQKLDLTHQDKFINKFNTVFSEAKQYADKHYIENAAIVLDIDETIVDNREYFLVYKGFTQETWNTWVNDKMGTPIKVSVEFINWAKEKGYKIFFITGRTQSQCQVTKSYLQNYNIYFDNVFCRPDIYKDKSISNFKSAARKKLSDQGYKIIINIGDQKSDLKGGIGKPYKVPNPIYNIQ